MVTVFALVSGLVPALLFVLYDSKLYEPYPAIFYILGAAGIFAYQTFDALDGKQARRIKAFSPLGQLFDHGCDSFGTAAMLIMLLVCLRIPNGKVNLLCFLSYISVFYLSNLAEKYTGTLTTNYANLGVTEVQFLQIFLLLLTGFGLTNWLYVPIIGGYSLNYFAAWFIFCAPFIALFVFLPQMLEAEKDKTKVFTSLIPLLYIYAMGSRYLQSLHSSP